MEDSITLNFTLTKDTHSRTLRLYTYETVKSIKTLLRRGLTCDTSWMPQQLHYTIILYNQHYKELDDKYSLRELTNDGVIWNEDNIQIIIEVDSGRVIHYYDKALRYLRQLCLGIYLEQVREDPNHNYMFSWNTITEDEHNHLAKINTYVPPIKRNYVLDPPSIKSPTSTPNTKRKLKAPNAVYNTVNNAVNNVVNTINSGRFDKKISTGTPDPELEAPLLSSSDY